MSKTWPTSSAFHRLKKLWRNCEFVWCVGGSTCHIKYLKGCLLFFWTWSKLDLDPFCYCCYFCWWDRIVENHNFSVFLFLLSTCHQHTAWGYDFHPSEYMIFIGTWVGHLRTRVWRCPSSTRVPAILSACVKRYGRRFLSWVLDKGPYWRSVFQQVWLVVKRRQGVLFQWVMVVNTFQHECLVHRCWQTIWVRKLFECTQLSALGPSVSCIPEGSWHTKIDCC